MLIKVKPLKLQLLQLTKFKKSYYNHLVLNIDDLYLPSGVYWIKGSNGSGKSTLLKSIAGIFSFEGDIQLNKLSVKKNRVLYRRIVNFAAAEPDFPNFLTGTEMIRLFADAKAAPKYQEDSFIKDMNMQGYIDNPLGTYSSGMLKKLSIVLAFLGKPELILLDEPLNAVDAESLSVLYSWIRRKNDEENTSFLLSSHQQINLDALPNSKQILVETQTKIVSWTLISSVFFVFDDLKNDTRLLALIVLFIAIAHGILIYQERDFNERYLYFIRNFPYSNMKLFLGFSINYVIFLLPEIFWLFSRFDLLKTAQLFIFLLSVILLFKNLLYLSWLKIKGFLFAVFGLLLGFYLIIMFNFSYVLIPLNLLFAYILFSKNYLKEREID